MPFNKIKLYKSIAYYYLDDFLIIFRGGSKHFFIRIAR
jgi:hypothetical protein